MEPSSGSRSFYKTTSQHKTDTVHTIMAPTTEASGNNLTKQAQVILQTIEGVTPAIKKPSGANVEADKLMPFVVWNTSGSKEDVPETDETSALKNSLFDSSFKTKKEANARALYLFFVNNNMDCDAEEFLTFFDSETTISKDKGCYHLVFEPKEDTDKSRSVFVGSKAQYTAMIES